MTLPPPRRGAGAAEPSQRGGAGSCVPLACGAGLRQERRSAGEARCWLRFGPCCSAGTWQAGLSVVGTTSGVKQSQNRVHAPSLRELGTCRSERFLQLCSAGGRLVPSCAIYETVNPAAVWLRSSRYSRPESASPAAAFTSLQLSFECGPCVHADSCRVCPYGWFCPGMAASCLFLDTPVKQGKGRTW